MSHKPFFSTSFVNLIRSFLCDDALHKLASLHASETPFVFNKRRTQGKDVSPVDNSECPACVPHQISLGYLSHPAASHSLGFGTGAMRLGEGGSFYPPQGQFGVEKGPNPA